MMSTEKKHGSFLSQPGHLLKSTVFDNGKLMLNISNRGEVFLYLYHQEQEKWILTSTAKLFDCPIVASDGNKYLGQWTFCFASLSGSIKICTLTKNHDLVTLSSTVLDGWESPITSCIWGQKPQEIILGTEDGNLLFLDQDHKIRLIVSMCLQQDQTEPITIRKGNNNQIYTSYKAAIYLVDPDALNYSKNQITILKTKDTIIDFIVAEGEAYNNLVVLTSSSLQFYFFAEGELVFIDEVKLEEQPLCACLGWGKNQRQMALYQCIQGIITTSAFQQTLTGQWRSLQPTQSSST